MDELLPQFRAEVVCAVTGWDGGILRTRRTRSGLFPETKPENRRDGETVRWTWFSFVDLCQARTVAKLGQMGFSPDDAVGISNHIRDAFWMRARGKDFASIAIVRAGLPRSGIPQTIKWTDHKATFAELWMENSDLEVAAVVDCAEIYRAVHYIVRERGFYRDGA